MDSGRAAITAAVITGVLGVVAAAIAFVPNLLDKGSGGGGETPTIVSGEVQLFASGESVEIFFAAERVGTTRTAAGGDFANVSVKVPEFFRPFSKPMQVDIVASGKSSIRHATVSFTIT